MKETAWAPGACNGTPNDSLLLALEVPLTGIVEDPEVPVSGPSMGGRNQCGAMVGSGPRRWGGKYLSSISSFMVGVVGFSVGALKVALCCSDCDGVELKFEVASSPEKVG